MNEYYVYCKDRNSYCTITSDTFLEVGQTVLISFDNENLDGVYECVVLDVPVGLTS